MADGTAVLFLLYFRSFDVVSCERDVPVHLRGVNSDDVIGGRAIVIIADSKFCPINVDWTEFVR
jgi:hypothetical protein